MSHNTPFSNVFGLLRVIIGSIAMPAFIIVITAGLLASLPAGAVSTDNLSMISSPDHTLVIDYGARPELSKKWTRSQETITFDHMYRTN